MEFRALWWLQYSVFANSRFGLSVCKLHTKILALITMNYEHFLTPFKLKFKQKFFWATNALPCSRICFEKKILHPHVFMLLTTYHPNLTKRTKFSWNNNSQKEILQFHEAMNVMFTAKWKSVKNGKIQGLKSIFLKQISNGAITHYGFCFEPSLSHVNIFFWIRSKPCLITLVLKMTLSICFQNITPKHNFFENWLLIAVHLINSSSSWRVFAYSIQGKEILNCCFVRTL